MNEKDRKKRNQDRLQQCYGPFARVIRAVLSDLEDQGLRPRIQESFRSLQDQLTAYNNGNSKVKFGFHNVTDEDGNPVSLAVDVLDDDAPEKPSRSYLLKLAAAARRYGLETGILWGLPEKLQKAVNVAIDGRQFEAMVKVGWDPTHVQSTGIRIAEAREGQRPVFAGVKPAQPLVTPSAPTPEPTPAYVEYMIKPGETLGDIATKLYDDPNEFDSLPLRSDIRLQGGQTLQIPLASPGEVSGTPPVSGEAIQTYMVVKGDTLSKIAEQYYNDPDMYVLIAEFNDLEDPNFIQIGQMLKIPPLQPGTAGGVTRVVTGPILNRGEETVGLKAFHAFKDGIRWTLTLDGVAIEGEGVKGTPGNPQTVTRIWNDYSGAINEWAKHYNVPSVLIVATIATESGGRPRAWRSESGGRGSMGLMQTLISTARQTLRDESIDAEWLAEPRNSIQAGTAYIAGQRRRTNLDPPLVAAAYNAGSLRYDDNNRWKMHQNISDRGEPHCDRFVAFFNDAVQVLKDHPVKAGVGYEEFYGFA